MKKSVATLKLEVESHRLIRSSYHAFYGLIAALWLCLPCESVMHFLGLIFIAVFWLNHYQCPLACIELRGKIFKVSFSKGHKRVYTLKKYQSTAYFTLVQCQSCDSKGYDTFCLTPLCLPDRRFSRLNYALWLQSLES